MMEDGEPRQSLPEDAVQEFKVSSSQYNAEFGRFSRASTIGLSPSLG
jgi:hypothetical protein